MDLDRTEEDIELGLHGRRITFLVNGELAAIGGMQDRSLSGVPHG